MTISLRFGSVCSGIEAASVAWEPLGWRAAWLSEVDPSPSAVLAHHWPHVPNLGNMLALPDLVSSAKVEAPDVLVGGTPCQAFSLAGSRGSLADERGALTLAYVEILNEIDRARAAAGAVPAIAVWENVPGVLSTKDNAFGCFIGALAGSGHPLVPGGRPVAGRSGNLWRWIKPRRWRHRGRRKHRKGFHVPAWPNAGCVFGPTRAVAWRILDAQYFGVAQRRRRVFVVASARDGFDPAAVLFEFDGLRRDTPPSREAGQGFAADVAPSLVSSGRGVERVGETRGQDPVVAVPQAFGGGRTGGAIDVAACLVAKGQKLDFEVETFIAQEAVTVTGQITHALNTANNGKGSSEDGTGRGVPTIAFSAKDYGADATDELSPTMRAGGHKDSHADAGVMPAVAIASSLAVRRLTPRECERLQGFPDDHTLVPYRGKPAADGPRYKNIGNSMPVPVMRWIGERVTAHLAVDTIPQQEARHG